MSTTIRNIIPGIIAGTWQDVTAPDTAFSWLAFTPQMNGGQFRARPDWTIDADRPTGKAYYVATTGSDSNDGLTVGAPLRKIATALAKADVDVIYVAAGLYGLTNGWGTANQTRSVSVIATGGRVVNGNFAEALTWANQSGAGLANTYRTSRSLIGSVWDRGVVDAEGDYEKLTLVADAATVDTTPGSWYTDNTYVWVRLSDDRAADTNVLCMFNNVQASGKFSGSGTVYIEGVDFVGGWTVGGFYLLATAGASPTGYFNDCTFKYSNANGLTAVGATVYCQDCTAARNIDDGFNYHYLSGTFLGRSVEITCTGRDNGLAGDIDNGSSIHDGGSIVRLMGDYARNVGRNIHDVTSGTTSWNLGCNAYDSASAVNDANWAVGTGGSDTAKMWLDTCRSSGSATDIEIAATAAAYIHQFAGGGVYSGTPIAY